MAALLVGCGSVPLTGRRQILLVSDQEVYEAGLVQYNDYLKEQRASNPNILLWPISNSARNKNYKLEQTEGWN